MAIKLGIIGLGRLGRKHAENIHYHIQNAELRAICSVVQEELDSVSVEMAPRYVTSSYQEIIENDDLDAIVIASSSQEHSVMICDAAGGRICDRLTFRGQFAKHRLRGIQGLPDVCFLVAVGDEPVVVGVQVDPATHGNFFILQST